MWGPQWQTFTRAHRTLRYDVRGFGRSPIEGPPLSPGRDLLELLDAVDFERASLVGVSFGGRIALDVAAAHPERIDKLVLVGAGHPTHDWSEEMRRNDRAEEEALARRDLDAAVEVGLRFWVAGPGRSLDDVDSSVRELVGDMQRRAYELQLPFGDIEQEALVPDLAGRLGEITAPTLLVVGEHDAEDIHLCADRLERDLPNTSRALIPGSAHLPSLERPEEFDAVVLSFLANGTP